MCTFLSLCFLPYTIKIRFVSLDNKHQHHLDAQKLISFMLHPIPIPLVSLLITSKG